MPYPVPPPLPPAIQVSSSPTAAALPTAAISSAPEQLVPQPIAPGAAQLRGTVEQQIASPPAEQRASVRPQPAIDSLRQAQLPDLGPAPGEPLTAPSPAAPPVVPSEPDAPEPPESALPAGEDAPAEPTAPPPATAAPDPPAAPPASPAPTGSAPADATTDPSGTGGIVELDADYQEYDNNRQVFTGIGNAELRFQGAVLNADRVQVNLLNRIAVAEGNARFERGAQVLRGDRFTYNFVQTEGTVLRARGEVFIPSAGSDFSNAPVLPTDTTTGIVPPDAAVYSPGSLNLGVGNSGSGGPASGSVNRIRFEADQLDFTANGWVATNVRLTNDPFSPPELEVRSNTVTFTRLSPDRSEILARNPRIVFDQGFSLPLLRNRFIIDNRQRDVLPIRFGFDERDRGGIFLEGVFEPIATSAVRLELRPQIFLQQGLFDSSNFFDPNNLGLVAQLEARLSPTTTLEANLAFVSPETPDNDGENLRASVRARQLLGRHRLSLEYSYRDRLFNGSLGYQTVQSSLGFVLTSPEFTLGDTQINYSYQIGAQLVEADTDREDLLDAIRDNNRVTLGRFQGVLAANRFILLWQGLPLPATPTEGLRYTPNPVVPFVALVPSARLIANFYSNGESQTTLTGSFGIFGQFGHYSRPFLDYTGFNLSYSQRFGSGESPFFFDRDVDERVLSFGIRQQLYGPFLFGVQAAINLDRGDGFDTDYSLEYNRRTYSILIRFNPEREIGSVGLRINDFNFGTDTVPFSGEGNTVSGGVQRSTD